MFVSLFCFVILACFSFLLFVFLAGFSFLVILCLLWLLFFSCYSCFFKPLARQVLKQKVKKQKLFQAFGPSPRIVAALAEKADEDAICGPVRQPAADQRDCRPWPPLQGKAQ